MGHHHHHQHQQFQALLTEKFFNACLIHDQAKKNDKNIFCFDCCTGICPHCSPLHSSHRLLQIRRYVYHDVIRLVDAQKLMDCAFLQAYTTNNSKVVFLNHRPQTRQQCRVSGNSCCITCDRSLQDPFLFCSLSCKLHHLLTTTDANMSNHVMESNFTALPEVGFEDGQLTPHSVLEVGETRSNSSSRSSGGCCQKQASAEVVRKKRSSVATSTCRKITSSPVSVSVMGLEIMNNRRKVTIPQRSPFY